MKVIPLLVVNIETLEVEPSNLTQAKERFGHIVQKFPFRYGSHIVILYNKFAKPPQRIKPAQLRVLLARCSDQPATNNTAE